MENALGMMSFFDDNFDVSDNNGESGVMNEQPLKKRGRPKGAISATISEVRQQAAEEKRQLKSEYHERIEQLQTTIDQLQMRYELTVLQLEQELELLRKRELYYQQVLGGAFGRSSQASLRHSGHLG